MEDIEKRIRLLYKDIPNAKSEQECQDNIDVLDEIKNELTDTGRIGEWDLEDIYLGGILGADKEDIFKANLEMLRQLKKISKRLGIDLEESIKHQTEQHRNTLPININLTQYQSQIQGINYNVEHFTKELENELSKPKPEKSKIRNLINGIIDGAKETAGDILAKVVLGVLGQST